MELIFWVGIIIGGIVGIFIRNKNRFSSRVFPIDIISGIFNGMITGFLVSFSIWISVGFIMKPKEFEQYKGEYKSLVSLEDGHGISGNFFIGIGNIGTESYYYGYEYIGDNRYKQVKFPSSTTIIVEDIDTFSNIGPYYTEIRLSSTGEEYERNHKWDEWMFGPFIDDKPFGWEIHIPRGSILHDFKMDLD